MARPRFYGHLKKRFPIDLPNFHVSSVPELFRALDSQIPGFRAYLNEHSTPGYRVLIGKEAVTEASFDQPLGRGDVVKIVPVVAGAKDALGQILTGAALIALSVWIPGGSTLADALWTSYSATIASTAGSIGWAMVLGGVAQVLSPQPGISPVSPNGSNDMPSYTFGSPTVTVGQGRPVPVFYGGPLRIGGAIVSAGVESEGYQPKGFGGAAPNDDGDLGGNGDTSPWVWAIAPEG